MNKYVLMSAVPAAFVAGLFVSRAMPDAQAQPAPLGAQVIDVAAIGPAELGAPPAGPVTVRSKNLVQTPNGTISVQMGDAPKHTHAQSDEIQYILAGEGTFWLGDSARHVKAGDLIVVPRGTVHGGSVSTSGEFKALAIKLPPPVAGDMQRVQ